MKVEIRIDGRLPIYLNSNVEIDDKKVIINQVEVSEGETEIAGVLIDKKENPETVEWKNGDECRYKHDVSHEYTYIGRHPNTDGHYIFSEEKGITFVRDGFLSKPESPEEKEKRERLEAAYDLYSSWVSNSYGEPLFCFKAFCEAPELRTKWLAIVDKTNYRKGE